MPSDTAHDLVLNEREGQLGRIRLNRPKALNSLSLAMIREISAALDRFEADPGVAAVLLTGEGERGLCAGGDIKAAYEHRGDAEFLETYFREEYRLNYRIARFPKPYVAVMDGITMGGGVGVSAHGSHRVVTERTRLAMPETGIGFFPDIGATWLLARAPGETGTYLGLTGIAIGAADSIEAGLADAFVPSDRLSTLIASLAASTDAGDVTRRIAARAEPPGPAALADRAGIDAAFAHDSVAAILAALERQDFGFRPGDAPNSAVALAHEPEAHIAVAARGEEECRPRRVPAARVHRLPACDEGPGVL